MTKLDTHWDVLVVGAGLGGLSAATRLARSGLKVLVLEQHVVAGGYAHHFLRKVKGTKIVYDFDVALHQTGDLLPGRVQHSYLSELGVLPRVRLRQFDVAYRSRGPAHDMIVPADADAYEALMKQTFPEHQAGIRDLFATMRAIDLGEDKDPTTAAFETMGLTLQELVERHVKDERVLGVFATLFGYLGLPPSQLSGFMYAQMWNSYHRGGCFHLEGGGQALSNAFVAELEANRGCVRLKTEVQQIITENGRTVGLETSRGRFTAPVVISNASAPATFSRLLDQPALAQEDTDKAKALPYAVSINQAYVGLRGDAAALGLPDRGLFHMQSYDYDADWQATLAGDLKNQFHMLGNHSLADPTGTPEGRSIALVSMLANGQIWTGLEEGAYEEKKTELQEFMIDRLAEAIPDVRERIEVCEVGTPHTMQRYSWNPEGSIYGYAYTPTSHSIYRPAPRTAVPGLYLAGAWTFPGGGFEGAILSGRASAKLIMQDLEVGGPPPAK